MLKQKIISKSKEMGFDLIGFAPFQILTKEIENLEEWLANSYQAGMKYMEQNVDKRKDIREILNNCKSVISLGMNYYVDDKYEETENSGKVSKYAWGRDYHYVLWEKLEVFKDYLKEIIPEIETKSYVDTGPSMDKVWAVKAGLGWQGKHSNIINKEIGSWFFISNIFTNYNFEQYNLEIKDSCGSCTACIDACPTEAIVEDYVVDANKCISYLTIENKKEISEKFVGKFNDLVFGCDICQDVCPWNKRFAKQTEIKDFLEGQNRILNYGEIENLTNSTFKKRFEESPILRARAKGLKRNANHLQKDLKLNQKK